MKSKVLAAIVKLISKLKCKCKSDCCACESDCKNNEEDKHENNEEDKHKEEIKDITQL